MAEQRPYALVTGASSGIGTEIARELATYGMDLLLTGRSADRLDQVAKELQGKGVNVQTLVLDLNTPGALDQLETHLAGKDLDVLINNAGFGWSGAFAEMPLARVHDMVSLNIETLTLLTRRLLPRFLKRGAGRILNVASTAAFSPCPTLAVYAATKAYVLSFSEALATELKGTGVSVTALCPGATKTRFAENASMDIAKFSRHAMTADEVARQGVKALLKGRRAVVTGGGNAFMAFMTRLIPRSFAANAAGALLR
ncbi:MAG: SDR family oxidoreductase [Spirochaetales bacterium]|nr:SDR family oxidoreductase [Spirochaetales bacterium]